MIPWIASKADNLGARRDQQDRVAILTNPHQRECLILVSDGVGGQEGGALASQAVVDTANKLWRAKNGRAVPPREFLMQLCQFAHKEIVRIGKQQDVAPRATIAAVYVTGSEACWVHSGDSRVYQFRDRTMVSRTRDHSVLQILVERGAVREEDMGTHPDQGKLLQSLGGDEFKPPTFGGAKAGPGDGFLVCSDGFWERISPEEAGMLVGSGPELPRRLKYAVDLAAKRGGPKGDNVSAAALAICGQRRIFDVRRGLDLLRGNPRAIASAVLVFAVLALAVIIVSQSGSKTAGTTYSTPPAAPPPATAKPVLPPDNSPQTTIGVGGGQSGDGGNPNPNGSSSTKNDNSSSNAVQDAKDKADQAAAKDKADQAAKEKAAKDQESIEKMEKEQADRDAKAERDAKARGQGRGLGPHDPWKNPNDKLRDPFFPSAPPQPPSTPKFH